jgi:hypothetical protein
MGTRPAGVNEVGDWWLGICGLTQGARCWVLDLHTCQPLAPST